jgi:acetyl esterase/lipase
VQYGPQRKQYVYYVSPFPNTPPRKEIIFFAHGGGWKSYNAMIFRFVGRFFASHGYHTLLAGYRMSPRFTHPAQLDDMYSCLLTGEQILKSRGVDSSRIVLGGQSAGAQLTALMAYDQDDACRRGLDLSRIVGLFLMSGPLNFDDCSTRRIARLIRHYANTPISRQEANPIFHVDGSERYPVLCIHGAHDPLVPVCNSHSFVARLNGKGQTRIIENGHHADLAAVFTDQQDPATPILMNWLERIAAEHPTP